MFAEALAELEGVLPFVQPLFTAKRADVGSAYAIARPTEEAKRILRECEEAWAHECNKDANPQTLMRIRPL